MSWAAEVPDDHYYSGSGTAGYGGYSNSTSYEYDSHIHTGDPRQDMDYDREHQYQGGMDYIVPKPIRNFIVHFHESIMTNKLPQIQAAYNTQFNELTESFFKTEAWPEARNIAPLVDDDKTFLILYKELYYRHYYARVQDNPDMDVRCNSYANYCDLFNFVLNADGPVGIELPNQWLWDIIDEFIYQFQSFSVYRNKVYSSHNQVEIERLNDKIWNVHSVLNVLHSLIDKSNINRQLEIYSSGGDPDTVAGEYGNHLLYKMLGYFSLVGLLRLHCLLGDYYQALKVLENIDFNKKYGNHLLYKILGYFSLVGLLRLHCLLGDYYQALKVLENIDFNKKNMYASVPSSQITTFYYVGFAYLMMRRYQDAIRTFCDVLLYIQRTKSMFQSKAQLYDQVSKLNERIYTLLAVCLVLHPMRIDESINSYLREKYSDKTLKMQKGDMDEFRSCYSFGCPKFISPVTPVYEAFGPTIGLEPFQLQLKVFQEEVQHQVKLPTIRSYLKLYTTLPISKLASFLEMDTHHLLMYLQCFKHKMKNKVWTKGTSGLDGTLQSASDIDFYIDGDMIHVADTKVDQRYGDFFIRQIHKFDEIATKVMKSTTVTKSET